MQTIKAITENSPQSFDEDVSEFPRRLISRTELTPVSFLRRTAALYPDRVAVIHGEIRFTWAEHEERVNRLASALRGAGLQKHDRVAILCRNLPPMLEAHMGVPAAGGVLVAINTRLSTEEVRYILEHSGARFLLVDRALFDVVEGLDLEQVVMVEIDEDMSPDSGYERFIATGSPGEVESWLEGEEEPISINYTSGTTGRPKGVVYTYRSVYLNALGEIIEAKLKSDSVYLWTLPMFHCNGWCFTWAVTAAGGTHLCLPAVDPEKIWGLIDTEGVSHMNGAPVVSMWVVNHESAHRLEREITVLLGGAPPSPTLLGQMRELGFRPLHIYGLTETIGPTTVCEWQDGWSEMETDLLAPLLARQGQAYVISDEIRVVDPEMGDVPRDGIAMGEVVMRGNNVMLGYFRNPEATEEAFRGGWFHSGDIAVWHPDGYIELRDRAKDIIISGGENISTIEVEQIILRHPAVLECAVVSTPHPTWGERPKAFVTLRPGVNATESELIEFVRERLAHFKAPEAVEFCELPKTSTGKVQKYVLREREWQGSDRRIN
jgi:fatty-acyl-CoA synthase